MQEKFRKDGKRLPKLQAWLFKMKKNLQGKVEAEIMRIFEENITTSKIVCNMLKSRHKIRLTEEETKRYLDYLVNGGMLGKMRMRCEGKYLQYYHLKKCLKGAA